LQDAVEPLLYRDVRFASGAQLGKFPMWSDETYYTLARCTRSLFFAPHALDDAVQTKRAQMSPRKLVRESAKPDAPPTALLETALHALRSLAVLESRAQCVQSILPALEGRWPPGLRQLRIHVSPFCLQHLAHLADLDSLEELSVTLWTQWDLDRGSYELMDAPQSAWIPAHIRTLCIDTHYASFQICGDQLAHSLATHTLEHLRHLTLRVGFYLEDTTEAALCAFFARHARLEHVVLTPDCGASDPGWQEVLDSIRAPRLTLAHWCLPEFAWWVRGAVRELTLRICLDDLFSFTDEEILGYMDPYPLLDMLAGRGAAEIKRIVLRIDASSQYVDEPGAQDYPAAFAAAHKMKSRRHARFYRTHLAQLAERVALLRARGFEVVDSEASLAGTWDFICSVSSILTARCRCEQEAHASSEHVWRVHFVRA
jgi:hypothetical protein